MSEEIYSSVAGEGPAVILLHGLFGASNNLGATSRALRGAYRVFSLDLPNHGRSDWVQNADLASLAKAVADWMEANALPSAHFLGHSLGGKVAMELALRTPERVSALIVADIAPVEYPPHHDAVFAALDAVAAACCRSRQEAQVIMEHHLDEPGVIQFLLMSLQRGADGNYDWRMNLEGIKRDYVAVRAAPSASLPYSGPTLFIKGGDSDYIVEAHREQLLSLFPKAQLRVMPGCGHWLHAQQPEVFNGIVRRFLSRL